MLKRLSESLQDRREFKRTNLLVRQKIIAMLAGPVVEEHYISRCAGEEPVYRWFDDYQDDDQDVVRPLTLAQVLYPRSRRRQHHCLDEAVVEIESSWTVIFATGGRSLPSPTQCSHERVTGSATMPRFASCEKRGEAELGSDLTFRPRKGCYSSRSQRSAIWINSRDDMWRQEPNCSHEKSPPAVRAQECLVDTR
jgi:hypothetical protein